MLRRAVLIVALGVGVWAVTATLAAARNAYGDADLAATRAALAGAHERATSLDTAPPAPNAPSTASGEGLRASTTFRDEILETPMLTHPDFVAEVARWVEYWETVPQEWFPDYLTRMTWFVDTVDSTLAARGLPWSLRYLPVIESGYSPSAVSSAEAVGIWQFMARTAGDFDIEVGRYVDDRRDPFVSTAAAAEYLDQLRAEFGSWFLALAAYNAGPDRIRQVLSRHAPDAEPSDALYWAVRRFLPKETADFVPNLFGAIIVASDPEAHGYESPKPEPFRFDVVPLRGWISFETAARAAGAGRWEIARLNPELVRGVTPGARVVDLRVPVGTAESFRQYFVKERRAEDGGAP